MKKIEYNFKIVNLIMIGLFFLIILLIFTVDYPHSLLIFEQENFRVWYYDSTIGFNSGAEKGPGMLFSIIFDFIAAGIFGVMGIKLHQIRKMKQYHYLSNSIFFSCIYLGIGRLFEAFYILTETDVRAILYVFGRIFIPLDNLAMVIFFSVCCDVFFSEKMEKTPEFAKKILTVGWITFAVGWVAIMVYFFYNDIISVIATVLIITDLGIILLFSLWIEYEIHRVKQKVEERQQEMTFIGIMLAFFIVVIAISIALIITYATLLQYIARTIKNILLMIIAILYYPVFIKPAMNRLKK